MASGCNIVASDTKPVRELAHSSATTWVDHRNQTDLLNGLEQALRAPLEERHERGGCSGSWRWTVGVATISSELAGSVGNLTHKPLKPVATTALGLYPQ